MLRIALAAAGLLGAVCASGCSSRGCGCGCQSGWNRDAGGFVAEGAAYLVPRQARYGLVEYHNEYPTPDFPPAPPVPLPADQFVPPVLILEPPPSPAE
jgi:hypothetical protein